MELTRNEELFAPLSLPWEMCNAFSAMFKRHKTDLTTALSALSLFESIALTYAEVPLGDVVRLYASLNIYAYDACMIVCARQTGLPLLTLDGGLRSAALRAGIRLVEVQP